MVFYLEHLLMTVEEIQVHPYLAGIHYPTNMHVLLWQACGSMAIINTSSKVHRTVWRPEEVLTFIQAKSRGDLQIDQLSAGAGRISIG